MKSVLCTTTLGTSANSDFIFVYVTLRYVSLRGHGYILVYTHTRLFYFYIADTEIATERTSK